VSTAWLYAAVSSSPQEATLDDQLAWGKSTAVANGWTITREFSGVGSGAKGTRELLKDLLAELRVTPKARRPKFLLMIRLDRLGRGDGLESIGALSDIRKLGVTVFTRDDGEIRIARAADALLPAIKSIVAGIEGDIKSDKWKAVHARRRAAGLHQGIVPFGVVLLDGKAVPYEPEAYIVREMFKLAAEGWGYTRLARWAKERASTKRQRDGFDRPMHWAASTVRGILFGQTVRSVLVDPETVARMEDARQSDFRARYSKRWPWPLRGAVRCTCGKLLTGHISGEKKYRIRYYACKHHTLEPGAKSHPAHRADQLEAAFVDILRRFTASPDLIMDFDEEERPGKWDEIAREAETSIADAARRSQKAWVLAEDGRIVANQLQERLKELDTQRQDAERRLNTAKSAIERSHIPKVTHERLVDVFDGIADLWPETSIELQQELAKATAAYLDGLLADPDRRGELFFREPVTKLRQSEDEITKKWIALI
jgi:DNA invertase Pin-like site-specific DNA recombinase